MKKILSLDSDQLFYYSALVFAFTLSISRASVSFFLLWFILLFLLRNDFKNPWNTIKANPTIQTMVLFIAFVTVSLFWSSETHEALNQIRLYSYWVLIPILAISLKREWLSDLITAFLLGMFVNEILTYGIFFDLWQINGHTHTDPNPFMNHIHYSILLATTAIILLNRLLSIRYTVREKLPILVFFMTTTANLFISGGRTGQVAFLVSMALAVIIHYRMTIKSFIIFLTLVSLLFAGAYTLLPTYKQRIEQATSDIKLQQNGIYNTSVGLRNGFWLIAFDALQNNPFVGAGIGDYKLATKEVLSENDHDFDNPAVEFFLVSDYHNQYLMILVQLGFIGFGLMLWFIARLYRLPIEDKELKELSILSLTIFFISAFSESLWISQFPIILFVFIVSLSLAASKAQTAPSK